MLESINRGKSKDELAAAITQVIATVRDTGKAGEIVYKVKITNLNPEEATLTFTDDVSVKLPKPNRQGSVFYTDDDLKISRKDPRQAEMKFGKEAEVESEEQVEIEANA